MKRSILKIVCTLLVVAPCFASAVSIDELRSQVADLQRQIATMGTVTVTSVTPRLVALYVGTAPTSVSFSVTSGGYPLASNRSFGILFGDGALEALYHRPECIASGCDTPDFFKVHSYMSRAIFTAKLVEFSGCPTDLSTSGDCLGKTPKIHKIIDVVQVDVR